MLVFCWAKYMFAFKEGNCFIIDEKGNYVNDKGYKAIREGYSDNGLATVVVENRWKPGTIFYREYLLVIDTAGRVKYKITTDKAYNITHNMVIYEDDTGFFVSEVLDDNGKVIYKVPKERKIRDDYHVSSGVVRFFVIDSDNEALYGFVNMKNEVVIEPIYKKVWDFNEYGVAIVLSEEGKYGLVNINGEVVCEPIYSRIGEFFEGLAVVETSEGKCGYINIKGEYVINPVYVGAGSFSEGLAPVQTDDGKWGFIDINGEYVLSPVYDDADGFSDGFALVNRDGQYSYIDHEEKVHLNCYGGRDFHEGYALVNGENGRYAYMDKNGNLITDYIFLESSEDFCNGFAKVSSDGRKGFINEDGEIAIELQFSRASNFTAEGHALVKPVNKMWGYINSDGTWLFEPQFVYATEFNCGVALVELP